jgi:hypothetical protein
MILFNSRRALLKGLFGLIGLGIGGKTSPVQLNKKPSQQSSPVERLNLALCSGIESGSPLIIESLESTLMSVRFSIDSIKRKI